MGKNNVFKFYLNNLFYQITSYIFPIIYVFVLPNILSVDSFSIFAVFLSYITIFTIIIDFGFDLLAPKIIIDRINKNESIDDIIFTITSFKFILSLIIAICLFSFCYHNYQNNLPFLIVMSLSVIPRSLNFYWWFLGTLKIAKFAIYTAVIWLSVFGVMFLIKLYFNNINLAIVGLHYLIANVIIMFLGITSIYRYFRLNKPKKIIFNLELIKTAIPYFGSRIASAFYMSLGIPIFSFVGSKFEIAVYSIGDQLYRFAQSLISPFVLSFYLQLESNKGIKKIYKYLTVLISIILIGSIVIYITKDQLQDLLSFNLIYSKVIDFYLFYIIALIAHILSSFFGFPLSNLYKNSNFANRSIIYSTCIYFIVIGFLFFAQIVTIKTLISAMIITETFLFAIRLYYFINHKRTVKC